MAILMEKAPFEFHHESGTLIPRLDERLDLTIRDIMSHILNDTILDL